MLPRSAVFPGAPFRRAKRVNAIVMAAFADGAAVVPEDKKATETHGGHG